MKIKQYIPLASLIVLLGISGAGASAYAESQASVNASMETQNQNDEKRQDQGGLKGMWNNVFHTEENSADHSGPREDDNMRPEHMPGTIGRVTAVSGTTLTVSVKKWKDNASIVYTVDASSATVEKAGTASTLSSVAVGDNVIIEGTITGTSIVATKIHDGMPERKDKDTDHTPLLDGSGQPIIGGTVTAISGSTISITNKSNVTYTIDATSAKVTKNGTTAATISNIVIGDTIMIQGTANGTAVVATSVADHGTVKTDTEGGPRGFFGRIGNFFSKIFGFEK